MIFSRDGGSLAAFFCFVVQALTVENGYLITKNEDSKGKRNSAINYLKVIIIGLTCLLMHTKKR